MATTTSKITIVKIEKTYRTDNVQREGIDNPSKKITCDVKWVDGVFENAIFMVDDAFWMGGVMGSAGMHKFYEIVDELKTLTNNPPVGCEPV